MVEKQFIEDHGIKVTDIRWLDVPDALEVAAISMETLYHLAKDVDKEESHAILLSCIAVHTVEIIEALEQDLKKPVVSSNQVTLWKLLRMAGVHEKLEGFGRLLAEH